MPYMCMACYEVYDEMFEHCPKMSCCRGDVIEVDELMLPIIKELNEKGYWTDFCCSGHAYNYNEPYIKFENIDEDDYAVLRLAFESLPDGWYIDDSCDLFCLRCNTKAYDINDKYRAVLKANVALLGFVEELKELWEFVEELDDKCCETNTVYCCFGDDES